MRACDERALKRRAPPDAASKARRTDHSRRTISLPASAVEALTAHRLHQLQERLALGIGRPDGEALIFSDIEGRPLSPDAFGRDWSRVLRSRKLPAISFHGLRHSHASCLIASGLDVLSISRRLGHANPTVTLNRYGHLYQRTDEAVAQAIEKALQAREK